MTCTGSDQKSAVILALGHLWRPSPGCRSGSALGHCSVPSFSFSACLLDPWGAVTVAVLTSLSADYNIYVSLALILVGFSYVAHSFLLLCL